MYSLLHPCEECGPKLATMCDLIKEESGFEGDCVVIFSKNFKMTPSRKYKTADDEVRDIMEKRGLAVYKLQRGG